MGHIFRRNDYLSLLPKESSKVLCRNKSFIYKRVSCLDATADSDYVKQKGSTKFLTLVKEESLFKKLFGDVSVCSESNTAALY